jgi:class 3 adenylate cyclase
VKQIIAVLLMLFILPLLESETTDHGASVLIEMLAKAAARGNSSVYCDAVYDTVTQLTTYTNPSRSLFQVWLAPPGVGEEYATRFLQITVDNEGSKHPCYNSSIVIDHGVSDLRPAELSKLWYPDEAATYDSANARVRLALDNRAVTREGHVYNMAVTMFVIFILGGMAIISQRIGGILAKAITQPLANIAGPVGKLADLNLDDIKHMNMDAMQDYLMKSSDAADADIVVVSTRDSWLQCKGQRQCTLCCKCSLVVEEIKLLVNTFIKLKMSIENIGLFIPVRVLQKFIVTGKRITPALEHRDLTLMLCKFRNFEDMVSELTPAEITETVKGFHNAVALVLQRDRSDNDGIILDFIGDAILAGWNVAPKTSTAAGDGGANDGAGAAMDTSAEASFCERAAHAVEISFRIQDAMVEVRKSWCVATPSSYSTDTKKKEWKDHRCEALTQLRIGVHACRGTEALIGNYGDGSRMKFSALGSGVNFLSRLQYLNDYYGTLILISGQTLAANVAEGDGAESLLAQNFATRPVDVLRVKGFSECITIYEVMDRASNTAVKAVADLHRSAFDKFLARQWDDAITLFTQVVKQHLRAGYRDRVAALLIQRCKTMKAKSPPATWTGAADW